MGLHLGVGVGGAGFAEAKIGATGIYRKKKRHEHHLRALVSDMKKLLAFI